MLFKKPNLAVGPTRSYDLTGAQQEMTEMLAKAVEQAQKLADEQQDAIAAFILEEIEDEARWDAAFARSHDVLEQLAAEAEEEDRQGLTKELDPDSL